jgi:hypothetical protein
MVKLLPFIPPIRLLTIPRCPLEARLPGDEKAPTDRGERLGPFSGLPGAIVTGNGRVGSQRFVLRGAGYPCRRGSVNTCGQL